MYCTPNLIKNYQIISGHISIFILTITIFFTLYSLLFYKCSSIMSFLNYVTFIFENCWINWVSNGTKNITFHHNLKSRSHWQQNTLQSIAFSGNLQLHFHRQQIMLTLIAIRGKLHYHFDHKCHFSMYSLTITTILKKFIIYTPKTLLKNNLL